MEIKRRHSARDEMFRSKIDGLTKDCTLTAANRMSCSARVSSHPKRNYDPDFHAMIKIR